jgi:hypothetical protein
MTVAEKLTAIAENGQKVFDAGKDAGTDAFWDVVQNGGSRRNYAYAFSGWDAEYIRPKHKVVPIIAASAANTFNGCERLKIVEAEYFDFSQKEASTGNAAAVYYTFYNCYALEEIEDIGLSEQYGYYYTFGNCSSLHTIAVLRTNENTVFSNAFSYCPKLQNLTIDGVIGKTGFNVSGSTKLSHDSLMSIINALQTKTSGTWTVTLGATNLEKLTDAEKAIATQKGWTLA